MKWTALSTATSLFASTLAFSDQPEPFVIQLNSPQYQKGVVKTDQGGIISAPNLRIQAREITYTHKEKGEDCLQHISARGDLLMQYHDNYFVGELLEFDLLTKTGFLIDGRAGVSSWFLGGHHIQLRKDRSFAITEAFLTTSVSRNSVWKISADEVTVEDGYLLKATDIRFQAMNLPLLYLPKWSSNLRKRKDPTIRYRLLWDKGLGPRLSMRYRFFSTETFNAYARFDYRIIRGPGGALEAEYESKNKRTYFATRNYGALDKIFPDEVGDTRFRFQGIFKHRSEDDYTRLHAQWDRLSDTRMISDFRSPDFEINTKKATYLDFSHYEKDTFAVLNVRPRINSFNSISQELPHTGLGIRPLTFAGLIFENYATASYLDYTFANQLDEILRDRRAGRIETLNSVYRPFNLGALNLTPRVGLAGIFYSNSPTNKSIGQLVYNYGGDASIQFSRNYPRMQHTFIPYVKYLGYSRPQAAVDRTFIFDIYDGYDRLDALRLGLRQLFFTKDLSVFRPALFLDIYSYAFWGARSFDDRIPKAFIDLKCNWQSAMLRGSTAWNIQENTLDYGNIELLWTLSSTFAFGVEFRHRSRFWWRKADYENYVVDFARPLDELLISPLSDQRNTLLTKAHCRLSPRWNMQLQTFHGWSREDEPRYNGAKLDFYTMIAGGWQMKLSYEYMPNDPFRVSYSFKLLK